MARPRNLSPQFADSADLEDHELLYALWQEQHAIRRHLLPVAILAWVSLAAIAIAAVVFGVGLILSR